MSADRFAAHMPPHVRPEFVRWLAERDRKTGLRAWRDGHSHGWHEAQDNNEEALKGKNQ